MTLNPTKTMTFLAVLFLVTTSAHVKARQSLTKKDLVLIYYANETSPNKAEQQNFDKLLSWLENPSSQGEMKEKLTNYRKWLKEDLTLFPEVTNRQVAAITKAVTSGKSGEVKKALIFTNRMTKHEGAALKVTRETIEKVMFTPNIKGQGIIRDSNPLTVGTTFAAALRTAVATFPASTHEYIVIVRSHGSKETILRPKLAVDVSKLSQSEFFALLNDEEATKKAFKQALAKRSVRLAKNGMGAVHSRGVEAVLGENGAMGANGSMGGFSDIDKLASQTVGTSKTEFVSILKEATANGKMAIRAVFVHACEGGIDPVLAASLNGTSIGKIVTSGENPLPYEVVDYAEAMASEDFENTYLDAFTGIELQTLQLQQ